MGCDSASLPDSADRILAHQGVTYRAVGDAVVAVGPENTPRITAATPESGVVIEMGGHRRMDLLFEPVPIREDAVFAMELVGDRPSPFARVLHRRLGVADNYHLEVDLGGLGATSFTLELRDRGGVLYRDDDVPVKDGLAQVGTSNKEPTSFHYIEDEDDIIVEIDYENAGTAPLRRATLTPGAATSSEAPGLLQPG